MNKEFIRKLEDAAEQRGREQLAKKLQKIYDDGFIERETPAKVIVKLYQEFSKYSLP